MPLWTLRGLGQGKATTGWPKDPAAHGQQGTVGMPSIGVDRCTEDCQCHFVAGDRLAKGPFFYFLISFAKQER